MTIRIAFPVLATALALTIAQGTAQAADSAVERGAQLATFAGCGDCHMPMVMGPNGPQKDQSRGLSGHPEGLQLPPPPAMNGAWNWAGSASMTAFVGPWGVSYATNLTPDEETGLGKWKEADFIAAMRTGQHAGVGRPIMPPMPWQGIGSLPDADLSALFAYLMAQPAVKNKVPDYTPPAQ